MIEQIAWSGSTDIAAMAPCAWPESRPWIINRQATSSAMALADTLSRNTDLIIPMRRACHRFGRVSRETGTCFMDVNYLIS